MGTSPIIESNRQLLDSYLDFGIGHYYTLSKILLNRVTGGLSRAEKLSVGLEVSVLAGASLDDLLTWYIALGRWNPRDRKTLLADLLESIRVEERQRSQALRHVRETRTDEFCRAFGIPWSREDLQARRLDVTNWRYTVDQARLNIAKALEDMSPARVSTPRGWVTRYLTVMQGSLVVAGMRGAVPTVNPSKVGAGSTDEEDEGDLIIPTEPEHLNQLANLTGNAAIGLFCLMRLLYVTAFGVEPRSPAFVTIWQELHPARGGGA